MVVSATFGFGFARPLSKLPPHGQRGRTARSRSYSELRRSLQRLLSIKGKIDEPNSNTGRIDLTPSSAVAIRVHGFTVRQIPSRLVDLKATFAVPL